MTEQALLDAIVADPDDDAPRLVYADHLLGRGDPRGELVALQCKLAAIAADDPQRAACASRVDELLREHGRAWLADVIALGLPARFELRRGFVEVMTGRFPAATLADRELVARAPLLSRVALSVHGQRDRGELARPTGTAVLERARELSINGRHRGNTRDHRGPIAALDGLAAIRWTRLRELRLAHLRTTARELAALLAAAAATLERLELDLAMPAGDTCEAVAGLAGGSLRALDLSRNAVDARTIDALARGPARGLVELVLDGSRLDGHAAAGLTRARFPRLGKLSLRRTGLAGDDLRGLAWVDQLVV